MWLPGAQNAVCVGQGNLGTVRNLQAKNQGRVQAIVRSLANRFSKAGSLEVRNTDRVSVDVLTGFQRTG